MHPSLQTPLCQMLGIEVPIVQAGMGYVARGELAAGVSAAGGLGVIGAASLNAEGLREEIKKVRGLTDRPFGVDILFATANRTDKRAPRMSDKQNSVNQGVDLEISPHCGGGSLDSTPK